MTSEETAAALQRLCEVYNRALTPGLLEVFADDYAAWPLDEFRAAVAAHRTDPERGRFFPTLADLIAQRVGTRETAAAHAAARFEADPCVDGTSPFDADRETHDRRANRRQAYIRRELSRHADHARLAAGGAGAPALQVDPRRICPDPELR